MPRVVLVLTVAALALPTSASARTIELDWREDDGIGVMRFTVTTLTLGDGRWSVRASFSNLSAVPLRIDRRSFALLAFPSRSYATPFRLFAATTFSPALPRAIGPGRTWRGTFGGAGSPRRGVFVRLRFGHFRGTPSPIRERPNGFSWLTAHAYRLR